MAGKFGRKGKIVFGAAGVVAEVTDWSIDESADTFEDTPMDPAAGDAAPKTFGVGNSEWQGQMTVNYDRADADGQVALRAGAVGTVKLYPEGDAAGKKYFTGTIITTKFGAQGNVNGKITSQFSFRGTGALSEAQA